MNFIKKNIYYLNLSELKIIAEELNADYYYYYQNNNKLIRAGVDKKINIINNIIRVLKGKKSKKTIISNEVIKFFTPMTITKNTKIYYGQYINGNKKILKLMKKLTDNKFKFGAIAQEILFFYWIKGKLLTYQQFATKWLSHKKKKHPEWKYLDHLSKNKNLEWMTYRTTMAKLVIKKIKLLLSKRN